MGACVGWAGADQSAPACARSVPHIAAEWPEPFFRILLALKFHRTQRRFYGLYGVRGSDDTAGAEFRLRYRLFAADGPGTIWRRCSAAR